MNFQLSNSEISNFPSVRIDQIAMTAVSEFNAVNCTPAMLLYLVLKKHSYIANTYSLNMIKLC